MSLAGVKTCTPVCERGLGRQMGVGSTPGYSWRHLRGRVYPHRSGCGRRILCPGGALIYRDLTIKGFIAALQATIIMSGIILIMLGPAIAFGQLAAVMSVPKQIEKLLAGITSSCSVMLLIAAACSSFEPAGMAAPLPGEGAPGLSARVTQELQAANHAVAVGALPCGAMLRETSGNPEDRG
jgi:hypothetical protein